MPDLVVTALTSEGEPLENAKVTVKPYQAHAREPVYTSGGAIVAKAMAYTATESAEPGAPDAGTATFALVASALLNPVDTPYWVEIDPPGRDRAERFLIEVPNGAGPYNAEDLLVEQPGELESAALSLHKETVGDHEDVDLTGNATGKVLMWDGTNFSPADTHATDLEVSSAITVHNADTTAVHGIADTSALETSSGSAAKVEAHRADTTDVHGITDIAQVALKNAANTFSAIQTIAIANSGVTNTFKFEATNEPNSGLRGIKLDRSSAVQPIGITLRSAGTPYWDVSALDATSTQVVLAYDHVLGADVIRGRSGSHWEIGRSVGVVTDTHRLLISSDGTDTTWAPNLATLLLVQAPSGSPATSLVKATSDALTVFDARKDGTFIAGTRFAVGSGTSTQSLSYVSGNHPDTTNTTVYGHLLQPTAPSNVTSAFNVSQAKGATAAASFTLTTLVGYRAAAHTLGAGSTITNAYGFIGDPQTVGTNNYTAALAVSAQGTLWLAYLTDPTADTSGIIFGTSKDTKLYRSAASQLQTNGTMRANAFGLPSSQFFTGIANSGGYIQQTRATAEISGAGATAGLLYWRDGTAGGGTGKVAGKIGTGTGNEQTFFDNINASGVGFGVGPSARLRVDGTGLAFFNATPVAQQTGIADADGTLADITTKFNSLIQKLENYALLATV